ncbi:MAG: hypothetical protein JRE58_02350 [Deltaproteobacteria bacterium]|nr:hypothetical protein [Deltaproteobacteria bacterium]
MGDGPELEWACAYTIKLFRLRRLRLAGYPFAADDLTVEEWMDLGKIDD